MRITDLHMHVVPHVDDGAKDMNMSLEMLKSTYVQGVRKVLCTSHSSWQPDAAVMYSNNFGKLRAEAERQLPDMRLFTGCEVLFTKFTFQDVVRKLDDGEFLTMNGTNVVLTEFLPYASADEIEHVVRKLLSRKCIPVIAHAERYDAFEDAELVKRLVEVGCLLQVNLYSLVKEQDEQLKSRARRMVDARQVCGWWN